MTDPSLTPEPQSTPTRGRYKVIVALCLGASIAYLSRNILGVAAEDVERDLKISHEQMGLIMGLAFFLPYALLQIPGGWLGEWLGSRRALLILALVWAGATALMGVTAGFFGLLLAYAIVGVGQAGLFPCTVLAFSKWLPTSLRSLAGGSLTSFMSLGGLAATTLTGWLLSEKIGLDWRNVCMLLGIPGAVWAVLFYSWFRDRPEEHPAVNDAECDLIRSDQSAHGSTDEASTVADEQGGAWGILVSKPTMWLICGQQFFRAAGYIFFPTWFPTYLKKTHGITTEQSGYLSALVLGSVVVGGVIGGMIGDALWRKTHSRRVSRKWMAVTTTLLAAISIYAAYRSPGISLAMFFVSGGAFFQAMAAPPSIATTIDVGGAHVSKVYSAMNMCGNLGAAACPWFIGRFVQTTTLHYGSERWDLVLVVFCAIYAASALCWLFINPNREIVPKR